MSLNRNIKPLTVRVSRGFGLIELMIAVVIVGILSTIAYPSYITYVKRTNEAEAQGQMMELAGALEAYRAKNFSYAGASLSSLSPSLEKTKHYTVVLNLGANNQSFTINATPSTSSMSGMPSLSLTSSGVASWENN